MNLPTENDASYDPIKDYAISMDLLFSNTPISDAEFGLIGEILYGMQQAFVRGVMTLVMNGGRGLVHEN